MKKATLFFCGFLLSLSVFLPQMTLAQEQLAPTVHVYFAPERPKDAKLLSAVGILEEWGGGNSSAGLCIKLEASGKEQCFFTGYVTKFNGKRAKCPFRPVRCDKAPEGFVFGETKVKVTYWIFDDNLGGRGKVEATDQIDSLP